MPFGKEKVSLLKKDGLLYTSCQYMLDLREQLKSEQKKKTTTSFRHSMGTAGRSSNKGPKGPIDPEVERAAREANGEPVI